MTMKRRRLLLATGVALVVVLAGGIFWLHWSSSHADKHTAAKQSHVSQAKKQPNDAHADRIRLLAAGDFIAHDSINQAAKKADGTYDYMPMMDHFTDIFHAADVRFCNDANLTAGPAYTIAGYPKFNAPTEFARDMGRVGCNMVNVGTNHSFDRNQDAINASIAAWEAVPNTLAVVGHNRNMAEHDAVHVFTVKGVKIAFLAYTTYLNTDAPAQNDYGVNVYSDSFATQQVTEARAEGAQIIIASIRWGVEYSTDISDSQRRIAQFLSDRGVSLILGHGSHVLEPVQQLTGATGNKTQVWYSLGNFLNNQLPPETLFNGLAVIDFSAKTHEITGMSFLPIYMHYEWSASEAKAENLLARHNIAMYLLDDTTQEMINSQQLQTTVAAQRDRITKTLNTYQTIPLITKQQYDQ
jgi:poly-gamma-glutamate capsule biosynthesis protein CapA/YwtB (metallophosphatase superfamily)